MIISSKFIKKYVNESQTKLARHRWLSANQLNGEKKKKRREQTSDADVEIFFAIELQYLPESGCNLFEFF